MTSIYYNKNVRIFVKSPIFFICSTYIKKNEQIRVNFINIYTLKKRKRLYMLLFRKKSTKFVIWKTLLFLKKSWNSQKMVETFMLVYWILWRVHFSRIECDSSILEPCTKFCLIYFYFDGWYLFWEHTLLEGAAVTIFPESLEKCRS